VVALGTAAVGRVPGVTGLTGSFGGDSARGQLQLRARDAAFDWPRLFIAPLRLVRTDADVAWRRDGEAWVFTTRGARVQHARAGVTLDAEFRYVDPRVSPELQLEAAVDAADVGLVPLVIPYGRLQERTIAWLQRAFTHGRVEAGHLSYSGHVRKFPFRNGEGKFSATASVRDVTLDYYPGFAPLTGGSGTVGFNGPAITADLESGELGGVTLRDAKFHMRDYKLPVLEIEAQASGDLRKALGYVQASPLGPRLGEVFMGLRGSGPARYEVKLLLPAVSAAARQELATPLPERDYLVRASLEGATVALPALRSPAQRVVGTFEVHNERITVPTLRGTILDGPFELTASPGKLAADVLAAVDFTASGRAGGAKLPAFIGMPATIRMSGATDWNLKGRIEKHGEGQWPMTIDVSSSLTGLQVDAPKPFAKLPAEARATRVRIELPGNRSEDIAIESGPARARLHFAQVNRQWRLERGTARFDGQPVVLSTQPGLLVTGDWPQFDLGDWLALDTAQTQPAANGPPGQKLMEWLGPVDVHLDRATVFGFEFTDVAARLRADGELWRVSVDGPGAQGQATIPADLTRGRPIELDMQRLYLASVVGESEPKPGAAAPATDPRRFPPMKVEADDFVWEGRHFGRIDAVLTREARGLRFDSLTLVAPSFDISATGSWLAEADGVRTRLDARFRSTDLGAATAALGYRDVVDAKKARAEASLWWPGGPSGKAIAELNGTLHLTLEEGQMRDIKPGAGRMLGLLSVTQLPRRLALDFRDVTDKGLAFNSVKGDFEVRDGNAYTQNLLLKGPAVNIGVIGRTGLATEDYDQTVVVSGNTSGPLAVAGALAAGPVIGAGVLLLSQIFKEQLQGLARVYYHVEGPWSAPVMQRVPAPPGEDKAAVEPGGADQKGSPR
ncbi:MAG: YhdP family phospholipid transporter, partial [Steroidobacteraceae bacterium]